MRLYHTPHYQPVNTHTDRDPNYDYVEPFPLSAPSAPKGRQCGECGVKFDFGVSYGYCCQNGRCPMGWNERR